MAEDFPDNFPEEKSEIESKIDDFESVDEAYNTYLNKSKKFRPIFKKIIMAFLVFMTLDMLYVFYIWPDFDEYKKGIMPKSKVIEAYETKNSKVDWRPLRNRLPKRIKNVFLIAEDSRFYQHDGFDFAAIKNAISYNMITERRMLGASTISQQTAKISSFSFEKPS